MSDKIKKDLQIIKDVVIKKATQKNKKLQAIINYENGKHKTVAFGAQGMSDFTKHKDPERKERYLQRHKNDPKTLDTAGFWGRDLLWNKTSIQQSAKDIEKKKGVKVIVRL